MCSSIGRQIGGSGLNSPAWGRFLLRGIPCVLLSPLPLPSAPLLWPAVLAFLGVRVPTPHPCTARHIPTHMIIRCPDLTHMKGDTKTHTTVYRPQILTH